MQDQLYPVPKEHKEPSSDVITVQDALRLLRRAASAEGMEMYVDMGFGPYRSRYEIHLNPRTKGERNEVI